MPVPLSYSPCAIPLGSSTGLIRFGSASLALNMVERFLKRHQLKVESTDQMI